MKEFDPAAYKKMVKSFQDRNEPTAWFDSIYTDAEGDYRDVFWADLEPNPYLLSWLNNNDFKHSGHRAIVIGCGVGDDAEALSEAGYEVIAFSLVTVVRFFNTVYCPVFMHFSNNTVELF